MFAVRLHDVKDLRFEQVPAPGAPASGWVLLDVEAAGICGSDLHIPPASGFPVAPAEPATNSAVASPP